MGSSYRNLPLYLSEKGKGEGSDYSLNLPNSPLFSDFSVINELNRKKYPSQKEYQSYDLTLQEPH
jgi:hypothetical protein